MIRSSRGVFITGSSDAPPRDITISGNTFGDPAPVAFNLQAVTVVDSVNVNVTDNVATGWDGNVFEDYGGGSVQLVVGDNRPPADWPTLP